jgi:4-alpha-glucanotransferase
MEAYHNSQDIQYRSPFGAAAVNSKIHLWLDVIDPVPGVNCFVQLWERSRGGRLVPMACDSWGKRARFTAELTMPSEGCLVWYSFVLETLDRQRSYYGNNLDGMGGVGQMYTTTPKSYQITVYKPNSTPAWYKNGIAYQIFPDRFFRGEDWVSRQVSAMRPEDRNGPRRVLQLDWNDTPFYCRNEAGEITRWASFGGTLEGIREKLWYLKSLGVTVLYLNPIFEAASNHKYDTGDYMRIDRSLGDEESFQALVDEARDMGIHIILDGVFSHTGADSRYFNRMGNYDEEGACQSKDSPYYKWYQFKKYPDSYECWWGITDLPNVNELEPSYGQFIDGSPDSVIRHWLNKGVSGWRLDVADELPDAFIKDIRSAMRETDPDSVLLGEVWEDASNKESYGQLREYFLGDELQSTMNYPFRTAAIEFMLGQLDAGGLRARLMSLKENYPRENFYGALNLVGSHDRARILTLLGEAPPAESMDDGKRERFRLSDEKLALARRRLKALSLIQFTMPGVPCIYYGDEAGAQGFPDPYNRGTFPWRHEDGELMSHYRMLTTLRQQYPVLSSGEYAAQAFGRHVYGCRRWDGDTVIQVLVNRGIFEHETVTIPMEQPCALELTTGKWLEPGEDGQLTIQLPPVTWAVILFQQEKPVPVQRERGAGVVCHLTAIPGKRGKATLTDGKAFVDFLVKSGQKLWQVLPVNPVGLGGSPYYSPAVFAGEPSLIDRTQEPDWSGYEAFCAENAQWLDDYALYMAIRSAHNHDPWQKWPEDERDRTDLAALKAKYAKELEPYRRDQYWFWTQWAELKKYANDQGVLIIGDVPLAAADDSADVWAQRELFQLDQEGYPTVTAGVPPDYYAPEGQNWGNPVYDWDALEKTDYDWWVRRIGHAMKSFDFVRLDHFRGFSEYFSIPLGKTGAWGGWRLGPGIALFQKAAEQLGPLPILAEDLGQLDAGVFDLLARTGFPGMDVYQFTGAKMLALTDDQALSRTFYGSTHDSQTLTGWCKDKDEEPFQVVRTLYGTNAPWVLFQLQDLLGLGDESRFNTPGTVGNSNWTWQAKSDQLTDQISQTWKALTEEFNR